MKPLIYICGPFRCASTAVPGQQDAWGIQQNVMRAAALALEVWRAGGVGLCPHMNTFCFQGAAPDDVWLDGDLALLDRCDAVWVTPDWERSTGAKAEVAFAIKHQIPVLKDAQDMVTFIKDYEDEERICNAFLADAPHPEEVGNGEEVA